MTSPSSRAAQGRSPDAAAASLPSLIAALADGSPRPHAIWYGPDGRTELSGSSLANWTAKVAGLVTDELALGPGDLASVPARRSWQRLPAVLGCWWAGLTVTDSATEAADVAFVDEGQDAAGDEEFVLSAHPLGAPVATPATHQRDFTAAVLPQQDRLGAPATAADWVAVREPVDPGVRASAVVRDAERLAAAWTAERPDRSGGPLLVAADAADTLRRRMRIVLAAWMIGGYPVQLARNTPPAEIARLAAAERAVATCGVAVDGLPQWHAR